MTAQDVLNFWFQRCTPKQWFKKNAALDDLIRKQFLNTYWSIVRGETESWRSSAEGRLAEIIVLDQFARNMFRGTPQVFLYDPLALSLAQEMVRRGDDQQIAKERRTFVYMPYMHSESRVVQAAGFTLFASLGETNYATQHKDIIDRFGRFPHRNAILGRVSSPEEVEFMKTHKGF